MSPIGCHYQNYQRIGDKIMTREQAKELLPIIQAFAEGKTIQFKNTFGAWIDIPNNGKVCFDKELTEFRIKPELKYRPFNSKDECWNEMLKHHPFGWVKYGKLFYIIKR